MKCLRRSYVTPVIAAVVAVLFVATAVVLDIVDTGKTPNRPIDGFEKSGYFFPKIFIWHGIRTSPGRYWLAYVSFIYALFICINVEESSRSSVRIFNTRGMTAFPLFPFKISTQAMMALLFVQKVLIAVTLVFIAVVSDTIADVTVSYLVGLCQMQILLETTRFTELEPGKDLYSMKSIKLERGEDLHSAENIESEQDEDLHWAENTKFSSLLAFPFTSILVLVFQDSYGPLNKLNVAYFVICLLIVFVPGSPVIEKLNQVKAALYEVNRGDIFGRTWCIIRHEENRVDAVRKEKTTTLESTARCKGWWKAFMISYASLVHLAFCTAAFWVTQQINGVPQAVTRTFFYSTGAMTISINICILSFEHRAYESQSSRTPENGGELVRAVLKSVEILKRRLSELQGTDDDFRSSCDAILAAASDVYIESLKRHLSELQGTTGPPEPTSPGGTPTGAEVDGPKTCEIELIGKETNYKYKLSSL